MWPGSREAALVLQGPCLLLGWCIFQCGLETRLLCMLNYSLVAQSAICCVNIGCVMLLEG